MMEMENADDGSSDSSRTTDTRIPYFRLLNSLANDLDSVLNDLYTTPPSTLRLSGDAFLEPYMQGLSHDVSHPGIDEVFDGSSNVFKKRNHDEYTPNEDRTSSFSSPVNSVDTPLEERTESHFRLVEVNAGSQGSLNQLISGDECSDGSSENSSLIGDEETSCDITLIERLVRSHPIWFLPGIQRAGAFHLLQGKEDGNFIVRQSSHNSTMAISVRLPVGKGPYIEHYLIQGTEDGQLGLESSDNKFSSIPLLIAHYCQCCDELPVQLTLPRAIKEAKNRQQLTSFALLGQEFWRYPMANPRPATKGEDESPSPLPTVSIKESNRNTQNASFPSSSSSNSPASSLSSFESSSNNNNNSALEPNSLGFETDSNIVIEESPSQSNSLMTTFRGSPSSSSIPYNQIGIPVCSESPSSLPVETSQQPLSVCQRRPRPTPPNTLNLSSTTSAVLAKISDTRPENAGLSQTPLVTPSNKTPPLPPPRWAKPTLCGNNANAQNFVVSSSSSLTSVVSREMTPSVEGKVITSQMTERHINMNATQVNSAATSLASSLPTIPPTPLPRSHVPLVTSPSPSQSSQVLSPVSEGNTRPFGKRGRKIKESRHYQESDISEVYYRSAAADKASDYEDLWSADNSLTTTFKPQPPPRSSLPFQSLDECSAKSANSNKQPTFISLTPDVLERSVAASPVNVIEPVTPNVTSEGRFVAARTTSTSDSPPPEIAPSANAVLPQTPTSAEAKSSDQNEANQNENKLLGSPFYAEPADAIKQEALTRRSKPTGHVQYPNRNRHSDPAAFQQWPPPVLTGTGNLERIDSKEELIPTNTSFSSSVDNLVAIKNAKRKSCGITSSMKNAKPVEPPKLGSKKPYSDATWAVDSSWEFIGKETSDEDERKSDSCSNAYDDHKLVTEDQQKVSSESAECSSNRAMTFQDIIFQRLPELRLSPVPNEKSEGTKNENETNKRVSMASSIASNEGNSNSTNSDRLYHNGLAGLSQISDNSDDAQTVFSEPWDSTQWEHLLTSPKPVVAESIDPQVNRCKSFRERLDPLLSPPRLQALAKTRTENSTPGATIRDYALKLAADKETVFARAIDNFIACTIESKESKPQIVMRNMRQFMSGMKNYLVTHGEREFIKEVERERNKLKSTEFLNLDAILEGVMHKLVISPLKPHLSQLFVKEYEKNRAVQTLVDNIRYARTKPATDLGVRESIILPGTDDLDRIATLFRKLQAADSPLEKLEFLLSAIAIIFHSVKEMNRAEGNFMGADDFLPIFVWVLVQTGMVAAEVEAEYMWGLLHSSLLSGEGGYYLTTLSSAVNVLKNFRQCSNAELVPAVPWISDPLAEFKCVFKVVVPNELNGSLLTKTLPVRPNMTTKDICKIIALKVRITNPQDYGLFKLVDGEEIILNETDCPQDIKSEMTKNGKHVIFAYKRIDAKIAWPRPA